MLTCCVSSERKDESAGAGRGRRRGGGTTEAAGGDGNAHLDSTEISARLCLPPVTVDPNLYLYETLNALENRTH